MTVWIAGGLFLLLIFLLGSAARPYDTYASAVTVVGLSCFVYLIGIPLEVELTGRRFLLLHTKVPIAESDALKIVGLAYVAFLAFSLGYFIALNRTRTFGILLDEYERAERRRTVAPLMCVSVVLVTVLVLTFPSEIVAVRDYAYLYSQKFSSPVFTLLMQLALISVAMFLFALIVDSRRRIVWPLAGTALLCAWGVYSNSKTPIVLGLLCLAAVVVRRPEVKRPFLYGLSLMAAPAAIAVSTLAFSVNRGGGPFELEDRIRTGGVLTSVEPAGPLYSLLLELNSRGSSAPGSGGWSSVIQAPVTWIPRFVWPGRPEDLALVFARARIPDWAPGVGYGYSPVAEGYLNAGVWGVAAIFMLLGVLFAALRNLALAVGTRRPGFATSAAAFYQIAILYFGFVLFRGPFQAFVTNLFQCGVLILLTWVSSQLIERPGGRAKP